MAFPPELPDRRRLCLIRHAESEANAGGRTSDPARIELTPRGWQQARYLAAAFDDPPALIVTSPYLRTQQTAAPTLARFPQVPHETWPVHEFTYLAPARCVNLTPQERQPLVRDYWERSDPAHVDGEGAESFEQLIRRVDAAIRRLRESCSVPVAVFSHGQFIRAIVWRLQGGGVPLTGDAQRQFRTVLGGLAVPNAAILQLEFGAGGNARVGLVSVAHLPSELQTA
jgi:2,3-bisphosphoglycerate-dependent phosphoglycerate mutase